MQILKRYWIILLIGLILRLTVASFTFHSDVKAPALVTATFLQEKSLNPYQTSKNLMPNEVLDDLPLSYYLALPINVVSRFLTTDQVEREFLLRHDLLFGKVELWLYLIYVKLPLIIFDLLLAVVFCLSVPGIYQKKVLYIWLFNPFTLWATAAIGQIDVYVSFFIILTWFFLKSGNLNGAALSLGLGGAVKAMPFLLLPFLLGISKSWSERFKLTTLALLPYFISVIPYLSSEEFRKNALFAPQLSKSLYASIPLSGGEAILIVPTLILIIYLFYLWKKRAAQDFLKFSIVVLLLILGFTHFHIQWFLWVMPPLIIYMVENWNKYFILPLGGLITGLIAMLFLFESSLQIKLFAPLFPFLDGLKGLSEILSNDQVISLKSLAATLFLASSLSIIFLIFKKND